MHDPLTYRYKRTTMDAFGCSADEAIALHKYKPPLHRRFFYALCRPGWALFVVALAVLVLTGCSDMDSEERCAANLRYAVAQAQAQALPNTVAEVK